MSTYKEVDTIISINSTPSPLHSSSDYICERVKHGKSLHYFFYNNMDALLYQNCYTSAIFIVS